MPPARARPGFAQLVGLAWRLAHAGAGLLAVLAVTLVGLPALVLGLLLPDPAWATATITIRALLAMVAVAVACHGLLVRAGGPGLAPRIRAGLRAAAPAVQASLLVGAAVMLGLTIHLFSRHGTLAGWALDVLLLAAGLWGLVLMLPVVPVAVVEGLSPRAAFARAMVLTDGQRAPLLALVLFGLAWFLPLWLLAATAPADLAGLVAIAARDMLAMALLALLPAAVYLAAHDR